MTPPFERTVCACPDCVDCCRQQPGFLAPGDFERIAAALQETPEQARAHFWASPGALVMNTHTNRVFRIHTITPRLAHGRCVFLTAENRCQVHAVAPYGCSFFDTHQGLPEGQRRSAWALTEIQADPDYTALRSTLPFATSYKPRKA